MKNAVVTIQARDSDRCYRVSYSDLFNSFELNYQLNSNYEVTFTLTYTEQYKDVFNACKPKARVFYNGQFYIVQQAETEINEHGLLTLKVTAIHQLLDKMRNVRIDEPEPTEDNPDVSGSGSDNSTPDDKPGIVVKKTDEQKYYTLNDRLNQFFNNNDQGIRYELHGNFPEIAVDCKYSLFEWINSHIKDFDAYYIPDGDVLKIYDMPNLQHETGRQFRYLNNVTENNVQMDIKEIVNDCMVYGGKMEKDITTVSSGDGGNGVTEPQGGDWTPVIQNAAGLVGEKLSDSDIANIKNRIRIESNGSETVVNNWDSNAAAGHPSKGLLQFIDSTFNYYCRPPYTNILHGLDQLIAMMNIPNWRQQISGSGGWSPHGAPISKATITPKQSSSTWGWPFPSTGEGTFTSGQLFGVHPGNGRTNNFHDGLDFGSIDHPGSEVHAIHGGTCIISRAWGSGGINWYCVIQDSTGLNVEYQEAFGSANNIIINVGDKITTGQVIGYRTTNHLHVGITKHGFPEAFSHAFNNDGTWIDPQATIKNGVASGGTSGGSSSSSNTTRETYYSLHFHYENQDSIKRYGRYKGKNLVMGSIYDMDTLKKYADATIQHDPPTSITMKNIIGNDFHIGDKILAVVPEMNIDYEVTLIGIKGNPVKDDKKDFELTFNNVGLAMKNVINAIYNDIRGINTNFSQINVNGALGGRSENRFDNISVDRGSSMRFSHEQLNAIQQFTDGQEVQ